MSQGTFIQLGPDMSGPAADGYGESIMVDRLETLHRDRVRRVLDAAKADGFAEGVKTLRAKLEADGAVEALRKTLHNIAGPGGVPTLMAMMEEEARRQIAIDLARPKSAGPAKK